MKACFFKLMNGLNKKVFDMSSKNIGKYLNSIIFKLQSINLSAKKKSCCEHGWLCPPSVGVSFFLEVLSTQLILLSFLRDVLPPPWTVSNSELHVGFSKRKAVCANVGGKTNGNKPPLLHFISEWEIFTVVFLLWDSGHKSTLELNAHVSAFYFFEKQPPFKLEFKCYQTLQH